MRATLIEILRQLNQAEAEMDREDEKGLELPEVEFRLRDHWTVRQARTNVARAMGLLLKNRMIQLVPGGVYSWTRQRNVGRLYRITADGKAFLLQSSQSRDRIA
jgi:hypothetical protein